MLCDSKLDVGDPEDAGHEHLQLVGLQESGEEGNGDGGEESPLDEQGASMRRMVAPAVVCGNIFEHRWIVGESQDDLGSKLWDLDCEINDRYRNGKKCKK